MEVTRYWPTLGKLRKKGILKSAHVVFIYISNLKIKKMKLIRKFIALLIFTLAPISFISGGVSCYPCGENLPGVACPKNDTECEIVETPSGWRVDCSPSGTGVTGDPCPVT